MRELAEMIFLYKSAASVESALVVHYDLNKIVTLKRQRFVEVENCLLSEVNYK